MIQLSDEQLNNLGKEALVVIVSSLQDQLLALQTQLDHANAQLSDNNRQIELLTEQIRIMNQRFFGRRSESAVSEVDGQISLFDSFNEAEYLKQDSLKSLISQKLSFHLIIVKKLPVNGNPICPGFRHVSLSTHFPMKNWLPDFLTVTKNFLKKFIKGCTLFRRHLSWMNIMSMSMLPKIMTVLS